MLQYNVPADVRNGYAKLMGCNGIFVAQKLDLLETITGCEMPNKYYVSALGTGFRDNDATPIGPPFFKCVEKSGWCARQFCHAAARPLNINVNHEGPSSPFHGLPFLTLEKPCKCCVFPCCCRPEMKVNFSEPTQH